MKFDAGNIADRGRVTNTQWDICIIGSGAAGLAIAHSFIKSGKNVIVLEASRQSIQTSSDKHHRYEDPDVQPLYNGVMVESDGITDIAKEGKTSREFCLHSRIKVYGGTTNCWEGWTRPLGDVDFGSSDPIARWPSSVKDALIGSKRGPFYDKAMFYCSLDAWPFPQAYTQADYWPKQSAALQVMPKLSDCDLQSQAVVTIGSPKNGARDYNWGFQLRWGPDIEKDPQVAICRNANVRLLIGVNQAPALVFGVLATTVKDGPVKGDDFVVKAHAFVLAAGCIENVRLMLESGYSTTGLPALGRYLMTHPLLEEAASFIPLQAPSKEVAQFCNGATIEATNSPPGVFATLAPTDDYLSKQGIGNFRAWVQFGSKNVNLCWEQKPSATNQIILDQQSTDGIFGRPLPRVQIALSDVDRRTLEVALDRVRTVLVFNKYIDQDKESFVPSGKPPKLTGEHAMGATRMADDRKYGVVDSDCLVHGTVNLFVAGGSVFPTGGWANPTLTIIALALRLAKHLGSPSSVANVSAPAGSSAGG